MIYQDTLSAEYAEVGITDEAVTVYNNIDEIKKSSNRSLSQSDRIHTAIRKLNELSVPKYKEKNWDGYDSYPILEETIKNCAVIINSLPKHVPLPDIIPEPNGDIGLDWIKNDNELSLSVDDKRNLSYAYIGVNGEEMYGSGKLNGKILPKIFIDTLRSIYSNQ